MYDELRRLAAHRLAQEPPRPITQATDLVHEAYLRLVNADSMTPRAGTAGDTSSPRLPRPCGGS
ncbi:MAG: ECF-type sigma factor [Isosphaeraceae bacterium]